MRGHVCSEGEGRKEGEGLNGKSVQGLSRAGKGKVVEWDEA